MKIIIVGKARRNYLKACSNRRKKIEACNNAAFFFTEQPTNEIKIIRVLTKQETLERKKWNS